MWPRSWRNQSSSLLLGTAFGLCLSFAHAQETKSAPKPAPAPAPAQATTPAPLTTPSATEYPGILQTFETLLEVDNTKYRKTLDLLSKNGRVLSDSKQVSELELQPDFLNSIILHSDPGYVRLATMEKCRFYDTIMTDLLRSAEGKIKNVMVTYVNKSGTREAAVLSKKDFLSNVVNQECPKTVELINQFQVKTLDKTLGSTLFEIPTSLEQCRITHLAWLNNPKTPYLCQVHEYLEEVRAGGGDPKDLPQRRAMAKIIDGKLNLIQKDYLENLCTHLDNEDRFCDEFLNVSFWSKIAGGQAEKIYVESICQRITGAAAPSENQLKQCLARLKNENDLCLYGSNREPALSPMLDCDSLSLALNHSSMRSDYRDCPGQSDQHIATNLSRLLLTIGREDVKPFAGNCSAISTGETFRFYERFDNDENWKLEACYFDKLKERDICTKTFFGDYGKHPNSFPAVVANALRELRGMDKSSTCNMVDSLVYNPLLLEYKSGCQIVYDRDRCFTNQCQAKILYNDRPINFIKLKERAELEYFPLSVKNERFAIQYIFTKEFKQTARSLQNLTAIKAYFRNRSRPLIYGVGCVEDLLPSFFKIHSMNQCSPMPFVIDGHLKDKDKMSFITRTALDSLQAPRIIGWSNIYSAVKAYQRNHPLKLWTLYALE